MERCLKLEVQLIIKQLQQNDSKNQIKMMNIKTVLREIRVLKNNRHDNIVSLLQVFRDQSRLYLVFEYVDRTVLEELESFSEGVPLDQIKKIIYQLLNALDFLHSNEIIHRDIKPENLLLDTNGVLKVCDFGFARNIQKGNSAMYTDYVSTRWYRAPELLVGDANYDKSVDIWALGCIFAELATGMPLFPGDSDIHTLKLVLETIDPQKRSETKSLMNHQIFDEEFKVQLQLLLVSSTKIQNFDDPLIQDINIDDLEQADILQTNEDLNKKLSLRESYANQKLSSQNSLRKNGSFQYNYADEIKEVENSERSNSYTSSSLQAIETSHQAIQIEDLKSENIGEYKNPCKIEKRQFNDSPYEINMNNSQDYIFNNSVLNGVKKINIIFGKQENDADQNSSPKIKIIQAERKSFKLQNYNPPQKQQHNAFLKKNPNFMNQTARDITPFKNTQKRNDLLNQSNNNIKGTSSLERIDIKKEHQNSIAKLPIMHQNNSYLHAPVIQNSNTQNLLNYNQSYSNYNSPIKLVAFPKLIDQIKDTESQKSFIKASQNVSFQEYSFISGIQNQRSKSKKIGLDQQQHNQSMIISGTDSILKLKAWQDQGLTSKHNTNLHLMQEQNILNAKLSNQNTASNYEMDSFPRRSITNRLKNFQALQNKKKMRIFNTHQNNGNTNEKQQANLYNGASSNAYGSLERINQQQQQQ
eukprot:403369020